MTKFKVGDKVKMKKTSTYYNNSSIQLNDCVGTVYLVDIYDYNTINVRWTFRGVKYANLYNEIDLYKTGINWNDIIEGDK